MIGFAQAHASMMGYLLMFVGGIGLLGIIVVLCAEAVFHAFKRLYGLSIIFEAMREWHKAHPERSRRAREKP